MGVTLNGHYSYGITVTDAATSNPVSIGSSGTVTETLDAALFFTGAVDWTISNSGTVQSTGTGTTSAGISLAAVGQIANTANGLIGGGYAGIRDTAAVTLTNSGSIFATGTAGAAVLAGGGAIANAGGRITGGGTGIRLAAAGVVTNTGSIGGAAGDGVLLAAGGAVGNYGTGAVITGLAAGVSVAAAGTVLNQGTIASLGTAGAGYTITGDLFVPLSGGVILAGGGVSNAAGGTITSYFAGIAQMGAGSVFNAGFIDGTSTTLGFGAWLTAGGTLANAAGGTIAAGVDGVLATGTAVSTIANAGVIQTGNRAGIDAFGATSVQNLAGGTIAGRSYGVWGRSGGTVTNAGTITSSRTFGGAAIQLRTGGDVTNAASGHINAQWIGVQFGDGTTSGGGTLTNQGSIFASDGTNGAAVWMKGPGVILNEAAGTIAGGPFAIVSYSQTTLFNSGVVTGTQFAFDAANAGMHNLIVAAPGAVFTGKVAADAGTSATGTLELAAGTIAGAIAGFGSKYTGFSNVIVDSGARWSLAGTISPTQTISLPGTGAGLTLANPAAVAGTIVGFDATETLTLGGITDVTAATLGANNLLTISEGGGGTILLQFDPTQDFGGTSFGFSVAGGSTNLVVPCFAAGTRLQGEHGAIAVERLRPGMLLRSAFGGTAPVQWIGHRRVDCARHPRPHDVWPIRVRAGAFAPGLPRADLLLSPDHALHLDGHLVPVRYLVNGRTVVQERVASVAYYHVELPAHDVVFAEGLPAETYLDTGNRGAFANAPGARQLHADFARAAWEAGGCAPLVVAGPVVVAARQALLERAEALGHARTRVPALRVAAGGRALPARIEGRRWTVALPPGTERLRLLSRRWRPDETDPAGGDVRLLGVALADITLDGMALPLDDARLGAGWHAAEPGWRWTDGDAAILAGGAGLLEFELAMAGLYWRDPLSAAPPGSALAAAPRPPRGAAA
jgi:hypothetical protein